MWIILTPKSFFPTLKICHNNFDLVFDPNKDMMLDIEGIKFSRIISDSSDPVPLLNPTSTREVDDGLYFYQWNATVECSQEVLQCVSHGE